MAINTTVLVTYDRSRNKLTLTGGNNANDGSVVFHSGPGNIVNFKPTGSNAADWFLTGVTWEPTTPAILQWEMDGTSIVLTDNEDEPVPNPVSYRYILSGQVVSNRAGVASDPVVIDKPADGKKSMTAKK